MSIETVCGQRELYSIFHVHTCGYIMNLVVIYM